MATRLKPRAILRVQCQLRLLDSRLMNTGRPTGGETPASSSGIPCTPSKRTVRSTTDRLRRRELAGSRSRPTSRRDRCEPRLSNSRSRGRTRRAPAARAADRSRPRAGSRSAMIVEPVGFSCVLPENSTFGRWRARRIDDDLQQLVVGAVLDARRHRRQHVALVRGRRGRGSRPRRAGSRPRPRVHAVPASSVEPDGE